MGLTPRIGLVIVLALAATQVVDELLVRLVPPPNITFYTHDWLAEQVAGAVRIADETAAGDRPSVLAHLNSEWLAFETSACSPEPLRGGQPVSGIRKVLESRLGDAVQRMMVSGTALTDPPHATSSMPIVIAALPALLGNIGDNSFRSDATALGKLQIGLQLSDGTWLHITEPDRDSEVVLRLRNVAALFGGLAFIAGFAVLAARMVVRPLRALSNAADRLGRNRELVELPKTCVPEFDAIADSFSQMQQRLKRFVDDRTYMLAAISHDLRTPLTRLRLFAECVRDETQRQLLLEDIEQMEQTIRASLVFASNESRFESQAVVDLAALLISLCDTVSDAGGKARYHGPDHAELPCQPGAMRRAFSCLIERACEHGNEALVGLTESTEAIEVSIAERGPGTAAGIELAMANDVFHRHGGSITLGSASSADVVVRVRLPKPAA